MTRLRAANDQDFEQICTLMQELNPQGGTVADDHHRQLWQRVLGHHGTDVFVAEDEGELTGAITLHVLPNMTYQGAPYAVIENVITAARARGQGIGRALMEHALARADAAGCYKIMLQTNNDRGAAGFYRKLGFTSDVKTGMLYLIDANRKTAAD